MSYSIRPTQMLHVVQYIDQVTRLSPQNSVRFLAWAKIVLLASASRSKPGAYLDSCLAATLVI